MMNIVVKIKPQNLVTNSMQKLLVHASHQFLCLVHGLHCVFRSTQNYFTVINSSEGSETFYRNLKTIYKWLLIDLYHF